MTPFTPNTSNVNQDRLYYVDGSVFVKEDFHSSRGQREAEMLRRLQEMPFVPTIYSTYTKADHHFIRMEYVRGVSVENLLTEGITESEKKKISVQLSQFISTMMTAGYYHGDLNESNILYDKGSGMIRVIDFEMAGPIVSETDWRRDIYGNPFGMPWGLVHILELLR